MDLADDDADPFGNKPRKKVLMLASAAGVVLVVGVLVATLSGGNSVKAAAGGLKPNAVENAPPVAVAIPLPVPVAVAPDPLSAIVPPAPPPTGASAETRSPSPTPVTRYVSPKSRHQTSGGVKLTKVQSAGVPGS